jgi:HprK-related kinase B
MPEKLIERFATPLEIALRFLDVGVKVLTNDVEVAAGLRRYYAPYLAGEVARPASVVSLIQGRLEPGGEFSDVPRADGKRVKEAVQEVAGGRLILKRATGVVMGLSSTRAFAVGDMRGNLNQGINLINHCYAKAILARGYRLLHASGVTWQGRTAALVGVPGAGKSTAALHCVEAGFRFLSNDRVLAKPLADGVEALGYPKQPRVNPGTLLHHPRLASLLEAEEREALAALPAADLWRLERKIDVDLDAIYGCGTVELRGRLEALVLLGWRLDGRGFGVRELDAAQASTRLALFSKDLGAFDLSRPGAGPASADGDGPYRPLLERVRLLEVWGRTDFQRLVELVGEVLGAPPGSARASPHA